MAKMNPVTLPEILTSRSSSWSVVPGSSKSQKRPVDLIQAIMPEDLFLGMLCLERKRAERSSKGFLLFLVEIEEAGNPERRGRLIKGVTKAINHARRGPALDGCCKPNCSLGITFTEVGNLRPHQTRNPLRPHHPSPLSA